jgi:pimeloyl-ACP methyl ester carboxylesterase
MAVADPCNDPSTLQAKARFFNGPYRRVVLDGVGHFPQRQALDAVARALLSLLSDGTSRR